MADKQELIFSVGLDEGDLEKRATVLRTTLQQLRKEKSELDKANKAGKVTNQEYANSVAALDKAIKENSSELKENQKILELNAKVTKAAEGSLEQLSAKLALVTGQRKKLSAADRESTEAGKALTKQAADLTSALKSGEQATGNFTRNVGNYGDATLKTNTLLASLNNTQKKTTESLAGLDSSFGLFGGKLSAAKEGLASAKVGLEGMKLGLTGIKGAIAATGIGLLLIALGVLYSLLTKTQGGLDFVERKMSALGKVVQFLTDGLVSVGKVFVKAFTEGGPALDSLIDKVKLLAGAVVALATFNVPALIATFNTLSHSVGNAVDGISAAYRAGEALAKANQTIRREESALNAERAKSRAEVERLKKLSEDTTKSQSVRIGAAKQAYAIENGLLSQQLSLQQRRINLIKEEYKGRLGLEEAQNAINEAQAHYYEIQEESLGKQTELQNSINSIAKETADASKAAADAAKAAALEQLQLLSTIADKRVQIAQLRGQDTLELEKKAINAAAAVEIAQAKKNAKLIELINQETIAKKLKLDAEYEAKRATLIQETRVAGIEAQLALVKEGSSTELRLQLELIRAKAEVEKEGIRATSAVTIEEKRKQAALIKKVESEAEAATAATLKANTDARLKKEQDLADKVTAINQRMFGKIAADRVQSLNDQLRLIDLQLAAVEEGSKEEYDLQKKRIRAQRDLTLSEAKLTAEMIAAINKKADKDEENLFRKRIATKAAIIAEIAAQITQALSGLINANINNQVKNLDRQQAAALKSASLSADQRTAIEAQYQKKKEKLEIEAAKKRKVIAQVENVINTARAITAAYATSGVLGTVFAAIAAAAGVAQGVVIATQQFARGGVYQSDGKGAYVRGAGTTKSDSINAKLSDQESVINAVSTRKYYRELSAMNVEGGGRPFPGTNGTAALGARVMRSMPTYASGGVYSSNETIDYERLGREMAKANMSLPAPRVAVDEINTVSNRVQVRATSNDV